MKIQNKKSKKIKIATASVAVIALLGGYTAFAYSQNSWPFASNSADTPSEKAPEPAPKTLSSDDAANKKAFIESDETAGNTNSSSDSNTDKTESTSGSSKNSSGAPQSATLSASQDGNSVTVITKLYGAAAGSCKLTITNGGKTSTKTADIVYQPQYSSCAGFSIPVSELGSGNWKFNLTASTDHNKTLSASGSLGVK